LARRRRTARSQSYLRQYGYPSSRELRREAQGLAQASVPTVRQVSKPYQQQIRSSRGYLEAVRAALADAQAGVSNSYSQAVDQSQGVSDAAQARLAALGLGADAAGVQAAVGARGDSATQQLIASQAAAGNYAAQLPGIAAGQASQFSQVTRNKLLDALGSRRDSLSQAFFQALQQVQSNHLAQAQFNQSSDQFRQQMAQSAAQMAEQAREFNTSQANSMAQFNAQQAESIREFNATRRDNRRAAAQTATGLGYTPNEIQGMRADIYDAIATAKKGVPELNAEGHPRVNLTSGGIHWKVPPAPNGAPREPNQPNSIFYMYQFLSGRYDPNLQPLILAELKAAYPAATWRAFKAQALGGGSQRPAPHRSAG